MSKQKLLEYQSAYSVELAGAPPDDDGSPAPPVERALVVIKMSKKSRAKTRKGAVFRWKVCTCYNVQNVGGCKLPVLFKYYFNQCIQVSVSSCDFCKLDICWPENFS